MLGCDIKYFGGWHMVKEFENFWHIQTHESPSIRQTGDSSSWSDTEHLSLHVYLPY